jgi:hypothetical protein
VLKGIAIRELGKNLTIPPLVESSEDNIDIIHFSDIQSRDYDFIAQNGMAGPGKKPLHIYEFTEKLCKDKKIPLLIRELPAIRNDQTSNWWRFSWNHYFLDEGLYPYDDSYDRWSELQKKFNIEIKEWHRPGDCILFSLQKPMDSALNRLHQQNIDYQDFCIGIIDQLQKISDRKILIRPHPKDPTDLATNLKNRFPEIEITKSNSLQQDFDRSWCMITYNSTSGVDSVINGIHTITLDSSAVSTDVSFHSLDHIESDADFNRKEWLKRIAFMQWSDEEIKFGYVWNLLKFQIWKNL